MNFDKNIGTVDRTARIVIGLTLILASLLIGPTTAVAYLGLLGIVPLIAGITGHCPPYKWLGINTYKGTNRVHKAVHEV
jgi:hypothetical protein